MVGMTSVVATFRHCLRFLKDPRISDNEQKRQQTVPRQADRRIVVEFLVQAGARAFMLLEGANMGIDEKIRVQSESFKRFGLGYGKNFGNVVDIRRPAQAEIDRTGTVLTALFRRGRHAFCAFSKGFVDQRFELDPAPFAEALERCCHVVFQSDRSTHASKHNGFALMQVCVRRRT